MQNPFDVEGSTINIEMMNPNLAFKSLKSGDRFLLTVEIKKEVWELLQECRSRSGMLLDADVTVVAVNAQGAAKPDERVAPKRLTPANILHQTFLKLPEFWEFVSEVTGELIENDVECKAALKRFLDVGSLSDVDEQAMTKLMATFKRFCENHGYVSDE